MCGVEDNQSALAAKLRFDLILGMSLATLGANSGGNSGGNTGGNSSGSSVKLAA